MVKILLILIFLGLVIMYSLTYTFFPKKEKEEKLNLEILIEEDSKAISKDGKLIQNIGMLVINHFSPLLKKGQECPISEKFAFSVSEDNKNDVAFRFYRGNDTRLEHCDYLGEFKIIGLKFKGQKVIVELNLEARERDIFLSATETRTNRKLGIMDISNWDKSLH